jgi:hypothetical protein
MKNIIQISFFFYLISWIGAPLQAQTPSDALMMDKGQICIAALYTNEKWDEYWEGTLKRSNGNIGTLTRETYMPMIALGIADKVNLIAALPYVKTEPSGGQMKGVSGIQDFGIWLKATPYENVGTSATFSVLTAIGGSLPASDYLEDYVPFSLGLGCPELSLRAILNYQMNMGIYVRGTAAYLVRGNAKIERDYYYTTHGVYSDEVDMPNAMNYGGAIGAWLLGNTLQVEATYDGLTTFGGFDMRRQDVGFPSNKMNFTRFGAFAHYHLPFLPGLGIIGQWNQVLTGRNFGQSTGITAGITYQFGLWNSDQAHDTIPEAVK